MRSATDNIEAFDRQSKKLFDTANKRGYRILGFSYDVGSVHAEKNGLKEALERADTYDTLLISNISRLARSPVAYKEIASEFRDKGVHIETLEGGFEI